MNNPLKYIDPSGYEVFINGENVQLLDYVASNPMLFLRLGDALNTYWEQINSDEYREYVQLREDENKDIVSKEESKTIWEVRLGSPNTDDTYNEIFLTNYYKTYRYHWNENPAWFQDAEWQQDWLYNFRASEAFSILGNVVKGSVEIIGGVVTVGSGLVIMVSVTAGSLGTLSWITIPTGAITVAQGYNFIAAGIYDVSQGTLNMPTFPWLPDISGS